MLNLLYAAALFSISAGMCLSLGGLWAKSRPPADGEPGQSFYEFEVKDIAGDDVDLSKYKGKVCLVVNVASK
jgi:hypothetical protein